MTKIDDFEKNASNDNKREIDAKYVEIKFQEYINLFSSPLMERRDKKSFRLEYVNRHKKTNHKE